MRDKIERKRNLRKNKKFERVFIPAVVAASAFFALGSYFLFQQTLNNSSYISPISEGFSIRERSTDEKVSLVEKALLKKEIEYDSVSASGSAVIVEFEKDSSAVLSLDRDLEKQISSLQFILARLTMEGRSFTRLDMRFDKPVIR